MRAALPILLLSLRLLPAQERVADVQFIMFSGRMPPLARIQDSSQVSGLQAAVRKTMAHRVPCGQVPVQPSTPSYTGVSLVFSPKLADLELERVIRDGYLLSLQDSTSCFADSGRVLERMAVSLAFGREDLHALGGAKPMTYLACSVPAELHPDVAPCATAIRSPGPYPPPSRFREGVDAAGRAVTVPARGFPRFLRVYLE